jgi:AcrR family transcriptional regulator
MEISPRKQPRQARAQATCAAIREAAARILVQGGIGALNTNAIADLAGVSVGTLYQYYPSKEAILADLVRGIRAEMLADLQAAAQGAAGTDLEGTVRAMVGASLDHHRRDPPLAAALERAEAALPLDGETAALKAEIHGLVSALLTAHGVGGAAVAAHDLSTITRALGEAATERGETDYDRVARRAAQAALGYLSVD